MLSCSLRVALGAVRVVVGRWDAWDWDWDYGGAVTGTAGGAIEVFVLLPLPTLADTLVAFFVLVIVVVFLMVVDAGAAAVEIP